MDYRVFAYVCAISMASGILFGLAPALRLSRLDVNAALKDGGYHAGTGRRGSFLSGFLVTVEMALAVVLLAGAGLMIRGFLATAAQPIGVDTRNILTMAVGLPSSAYPGAREQAAFFERLEKQAAAIPGARMATVASSTPDSQTLNYEYQLESGAPVEQRAVPHVDGVVIGDQYFAALRTGVVRGRDFTEADRGSDAPVVIVNQLCAARLWRVAAASARRARTPSARDCAWATPSVSRRSTSPNSPESRWWASRPTFCKARPEWSRWSTGTSGRNRSGP